MGGVGELLSCFQQNRLVRPSSEVLNFVDLVRAVLRLAGAEGINADTGVREIADLIGPAQHYVFILIDGVGMDLLEALPEEGFLRSHLERTLQSVFPSTTASALTTLATGEWPSAHGVPGWWTYLDELDLSATTLRFQERFGGRPLGEWGLRAEDVFPVPSQWGGLKHAPQTVVPAQITHTVYSRYCFGPTPQAGYERLGEAFAAVAARLAACDGSTLTYVYLPQMDSVCHKKGTGHDGVAGLLGELDRALTQLASQIEGRARLVVTADHGLVDTPEDKRFVLGHDEPLIGHLLCPPTGEPSVPIFHVRPGRQQSFLEAFADRLGQHFILITPDEAERLRLFGPGTLSPLLRRRLGSFIGVAPEPAAIYYRPPNEQPHVHAAVHAGLSRSEMLVPLILA